MIANQLLEKFIALDVATISSERTPTQKRQLTIVFQKWRKATGLSDTQLNKAVIDLVNPMVQARQELRDKIEVYFNKLGG